MSTTAETPPDFPAYRSILEHLYCELRKTVPEIMEIMRDEYGFIATRKTYYQYLAQKWGKRKHTSKEESLAMLEIRWQRRVEENKETQFTRLDRDVDDKNLDRFAKRHNWKKDGSSLLPGIRVATPPNIRYRTPDPDTPTNLSPPGNPSYPRSMASEEEQAPVEGPLERYKGDALSSGDVPTTWQYNHGSAGHQPSNQTSMPCQLTTNPFLGHPIPKSQHGTGHTFASSPYQGHTALPPHTTDIPGVSSWGYNSQLPQQATQSSAFGMYPNSPAFPGNYAQRIDHMQGTVAAAPFYNATQPLGAVHHSELAMNVSGNIPLRGTAVSHHAHPPGSMLPEGVVPSSAMPFPHREDSALRAEDDELDELDSLTVWPRKRARHM